MEKLRNEIITETNIQWHSPEEIPCIKNHNKQILVLVEDRMSGHDYVMYTCIRYSTNEEKVKFGNNKVIAWAYIDLEDIVKNINLAHFDKEWINVLHNNCVYKK